MKTETEPFVVELLRQLLAGKTVSQLSATLGFPEDRTMQRLRAATTYCLDRPDLVKAKTAAD
jgi:hypothetical protein